MNFRRYRYLAGPLAIGAGAGLSSGVLYSLMSQGSVPGLMLSFLAPLPIMLAMLGFGRMVGIVSLVCACVAVALLVPVVAPRVPGTSVLDTTARTALSFAFMFGAPALWLAYLASMSRPSGQSQWQPTAPNTTTYLREYVPVERIVTACVAIAATVVVVGVIVVVLRFGSLDRAVDQVASELAPILEQMISSSTRIPAGTDVPRMARLMVVASAPVAAAMLFLVLLIDLWLAAKIARLSGRLQRPWPDIALELQVPRPYGILLGAAFATTFLGGPAAVIASIVAVVIAMAFALQGLAVLHVVSRGWPARGLFLWLVYGLLLALLPSGLSPLLCTVLGLVESLHSFRNRGAAPPKT